MKRIVITLSALLLAPLASLHAADLPAGKASIDRHALVTRHNITWNEVAGRLPLGNGEFCFGADATGLQTFAGNSMSHWGWRSFPLPEGWTPDRVPSTGTFQKGRNTGGDNFPAGTDAVLSQYLMAAMSAGSWPSSENGLLGIDAWRGQFHMEMVWWHLAHYALWDRWDLADKAIGCYRRFVPAARELAAQLGYKGLKWQKSVGPEGRTAPWVGNQVLLWKQPHPIFFAELEYRLRPTRATLDRWADIVDGTAEHMADYPTKDETTGLYSLTPSMPPSEQGIR